MSIVDSIIQRKAGQASHYVEAGAREGGTTGHSAVEGGLRGHSIGETWPYRVVYLGGGGAELYRGSTLVRSYAPVLSRHAVDARVNAEEDAHHLKWCEDPANYIQYTVSKTLPAVTVAARTANVLAQQPIFSDHINHPGAC